jgi:hypothetical protein
MYIVNLHILLLFCHVHVYCQPSHFTSLLSCTCILPTFTFYFSFIMYMYIANLHIMLLLFYHVHVYCQPSHFTSLLSCTCILPTFTFYFSFVMYMYIANLHILLKSWIGCEHNVIKFVSDLRHIGGVYWYSGFLRDI